MNVKKCVVETPVVPPTPQSDLCALQERQKICPDAKLPPPPPPPPQPPKCHALCWERIKNPLIEVKTERRKCPKVRILTGTARCDELIEKKQTQDKKFTCRTEIPPPPPPPTPDFCKLQQRDQKNKECLLRLKRYLT